MSPDGKAMASTSTDGSVTLWDMGLGIDRFSVAQHEGFATSLAFAPDGKTLASAGGTDLDTRHNVVTIWDANTGKERAVLKGHGSAVTSVAFVPGGKLLATGSSDQTVRLWDVSVYKQAPILDGRFPTLTSLFGLAIAPDGTTIAVGGGTPFHSYSGRASDIKLWNMNTGQA